MLNRRGFLKIGGATASRPFHLEEMHKNHPCHALE